jgi:hypothetical protein
MTMISTTGNPVFATDNPVSLSVLFVGVGPFVAMVDRLAVVFCWLRTTHAVASLFIT